MRGLQCVWCGEGLGEDAACPGCDTKYPVLGNTPATMVAPAAARRSWREGFAMMLAQQQRQHDQIVAARAEAMPFAHARLDAMLAALKAQGDALRSLMARVGLPPLPVPRAAPKFNPHLGYMQMLRDWAWPEDVQNARAVAAMTEAASDVRWGEVIVLGAGAGGLTAQLHAATQADATIAVDINPLPLLVFDRLVAGEDVDLWEFPAYPSAPDRWAIEHRLQRPARTDGLHTLVADALALPFATARFDVVVTHWFLDRVGRDPASVASVVHRVLRPGGVWVNRGPLLYEASRGWAGRPDIIEACAWARALGFDLPDPVADQVDYLCSPWCTQRRQETVYTFVATRAESTPWLDDETEPVPKSIVTSDVTPSDPIARWCLGEVDGKRSVADLVAKIRERGDMPFATGREGVRERLHRAWARGTKTSI